ncbi:MAG TPA: DPP IV N-terminal domain-containing protein, partial [Blastocatellia bacterium]|nr:DPP IV N-terminal domain-containing protein [Blastocatellia bacterium]
MKKHLALAFAIISILAIIVQAKHAPAPDDLFAIKDVGDARLSPDGATIVYIMSSTNREKNSSTSNLWLVPTNGGQPAQLTTGEANDSTPRWSPDGKKIAFASNRDGKSAIWIVDVASRETRMITLWERSNFFLSKAGEMFCWSPDSKQIA